MKNIRYQFLVSKSIRVQLMKREITFGFTLATVRHHWYIFLHLINNQWLLHVTTVFWRADAEHVSMQTASLGPNTICCVGAKQLALEQRVSIQEQPNDRMYLNWHENDVLDLERRLWHCERLTFFFSRSKWPLNGIAQVQIRTKRLLTLALRLRHDTHIDPLVTFLKGELIFAPLNGGGKKNPLFSWSSADIHIRQRVDGLMIFQNF